MAMSREKVENPGNPGASSVSDVARVVIGCGKQRETLTTYTLSSTTSRPSPLPPYILGVKYILIFSPSRLFPLAFTIPLSHYYIYIFKQMTCASIA